MNGFLFEATSTTTTTEPTSTSSKYIVSKWCKENNVILQLMANRNIQKVVAQKVK